MSYFNRVWLVKVSSLDLIITSCSRVVCQHIDVFKKDFCQVTKYFFSKVHVDLGIEHLL